MRNTLDHFFIHMRIYGKKHESLYLVSIMLFFWSIFNGIFTYLTPIIITSHGYSDGEMGLIYSTSSVAGGIWDFLISKFMIKTHYTRHFFYMFFLSLLGLLALYTANTVVLFVFAMALWGIFYDFMSIGSFDFVGRQIIPEEHASSSGVMDVFRCLGQLMAPLLAGYLIGSSIGDRPFIVALIFWFISFVLFGILITNFKYRVHENKEINVHKKLNVLIELKVWGRVGKILSPILFFTAFLNLVDAFFWTIGPLYSLKYSQYDNIGGLFVTAYMLPLVITGWFVGRITKKIGKKKTAFLALLFSSTTLLPLFFFQMPLYIVATAFIFSMFNTIAWPALRGAYADYISETKTLDKEIEGLADFFGNVGYMFGPALAGIFASLFGISQTFGILGICGIFVALFLLKVTPKEIKVKVKM